MAHRPGTRAGRASVIRLFLAFCARIRVRHTKLSYIHPCWYIEYLARLSYTPGVISNHISHLRTFYKLAGLNAAPLHHYRVNLALRAVAITIRHTPVPKLAVTPDILRKVLKALRATPDSQGVVLAVILMFMGFLRQSSLTPLTVKAFDPSRHLTRGDIARTDLGLSLRIKWSKTIQRSCDMKTILIPPTADPDLCPIRAYAAYNVAFPSRGRHTPLLVYADNNPITTRYISRAWSRAVGEAGLPQAAYSLHSLRRGGASYTYNDAKAKLNDVMAQGTWKSLAVRDYIRPQENAPNTVYRALSAL